MVIDILLNNGKHLKLPADLSIDWVQENMFFEDDVKLRSKYSYPFAIARKANSDALDWADVLQSRGKIVSRPCVIYVSGIQFYKGQINILDWTEDTINIAISRNTTDVDTSKYIDEMDLGSYGAIATSTARNADRAKYFPEVDYAFPQVVQWNKDEVDKWGTIALGKDYNLINWQQGATENANGEEVAIPMFYTLSALRSILNNLGFALKTSLYSDAFFKKNLIFNPVMANTGNANCLKLEAFSYNGGFGVVRMRDKLSCFSVPVGAAVWIIVYEFDQYGINNTTGFAHIVSAPDLVNIAAFMTAIRTTFIATITNAILISEDYTNDLPAFTVQCTTGDEFIIKAPSNTPPDLSSRLAREAARGVFPLMVSFNDGYTFQSQVKMNKHLPHITVSAFLNALKSTYNLSITFDEVNEVVLVEERKSYLDKSKKVDFSDYLLSITEGAPNEKINYKFIFNNDADNDLKAEGLETYPDNYPEMKLKPITELEMGSGRLKMEFVNNSAAGEAWMPSIDMPMGDYTDTVPFGLRFLNLAGYINDSVGYDFVSADDDGLIPNDLYEAKHKEWYEAVGKMEKAPILYFSFPMDVLKSITNGIWKVNHNDIMWKRITTSIHNTNGIQESKVEGYKI